MEAASTGSELSSITTFDAVAAVCYHSGLQYLPARPNTLHAAFRTVTAAAREHHSHAAVGRELGGLEYKGDFVPFSAELETALCSLHLSGLLDLMNPFSDRYLIKSSLLSVSVAANLPETELVAAKSLGTVLASALAQRIADQ